MINSVSEPELGQEIIYYELLEVYIHGRADAGKKSRHIMGLIQKGFIWETGLELLPQENEAESVDMIFADPPYLLSNNA